MVETPQIVWTVAQHYAYLYLKVPTVEIRKFMGAGLQEVYAAVSAAGAEPSGPWFTHHRRRPEEFFDFEICVPLDEPLRLPKDSLSRVEAGLWSPMRVARTVFDGNYSGLPAAWGELQAWMTAQGLNPAKEMWERYLVNPDSSKNPEEWRTELNWPIAD